MKTGISGRPTAAPGVSLAVAVTATVALMAVALMAVTLTAGAPRAAAASPQPVETPMLEPLVASGKLPPVADRLPEQPLVVKMTGYKSLGRQGGNLRTLIGRPKDTKLLVVYGYARLVGYNENFELVPDILESVEVENDRVFTLKLRKGHKWSDGQPFTTEDFRYYWEDVANNKELSPTGPPVTMIVDGEAPKFEVLDEITVRYSWSKPNPFFLTALAQAAPLFIYRPAYYLKQFHVKYANPAELAKRVKKARMRNWAPLHNRVDNMYKANNPDLPTLQPWRIITRPPSNRFVAERNPFFHRIDTAGRQLPYIDRVMLFPTNSKLVPAKASAGETDLQARNLSFKDFTFLKQNEKRSNYTTYLWRTARGSQLALYPNLNARDPVWRALLRDVRFRRALSLGIDREAINQSLFFGLALEGNNTVLPESPLYKEDYRTKWATYDPDTANALLDEIGLTKRNSDDIRLMPDGRPLEIVVETAGEDTEQTDVLELIRDSWGEIGIKLFAKPSQRQVFRNRVFSGETVMAVWSGLENGLPTADMSPAELAPTTQMGLQWPKWGQYFETKGVAGAPPDLPEGKELADLNRQWRSAESREERKRIWQRMLEIHAEQQFTIGTVAGVQQPVVVANTLKNVPKDGVYNWEPGSHFGIYRPDTFWFDTPK